MNCKILAGVVALGLLSLPAQAGEIDIHHAYARSANPKSAAAFMVIYNHGEAERLVSARSDIAARVELHGHIEEDGVMKMRPVEGGIAVPEDGQVTLQRGGLHVMFTGVKSPLEQGQSFPLTLVFESGKEVTIDVSVDNARKPGMHHHHDGEDSEHHQHSD